jgi:hypothetical protein
MPFPPRRIFLPSLALTIIFLLSACGGAATASIPEKGTAVALTRPASGTATNAPSAASTPTPVLPYPTLQGAGGEPQPAIPETRRLTLEFPPKMKADAESDIVRLTLEVDDLGNVTPTAEFEGHVVTGETVAIPNLYETHFVTAEARFDMAGMAIFPSGPTYEPMKQGQSVTFHWSIRPPQTGVYRGTIWLHLNFVDRVSGEESRTAVSAQVVEIEAVDFFGFSVDFVRTSGLVGSVLGVIAGFPFLNDIVKFLFGRRSKKRKAPRR